MLLERSANDLHVVQLMPLPSHLALLKSRMVYLSGVPAYLGYPGKRLLMGVVVVSV